jgi:hypothetical protein
MMLVKGAIVASVFVTICLEGRKKTTGNLKYLPRIEEGISLIQVHGVTAAVTRLVVYLRPISSSLVL